MDEKEIDEEIHQHRREKEVVRKYDILTLESKGLVDQMNGIWEEKEKLRSEYQTLTGNDISKRHEPR